MVGVDRFGRDVIYTDVDEITAENVCDVLAQALTVHNKNRADIEYLYDYYKGKQPILSREALVGTPEINNKIVVNHANEIVNFKVDMLFNEPVQYISRGDGKEDIATKINELNNYMFVAGNDAKNRALAYWFTICGVAYKILIPNKSAKEDEAPFKVYVSDPRNTFIVYLNDIDETKIMGVRYITRKENEVVFSVYTRNKYFEIAGNDAIGVTGVNGFKIIKEEPLYLGEVPFYEYHSNFARLGEFEIVISLLNACNSETSSRLDNVEAIIQALLVLQGVDVEDEDFLKLKKLGAINIPEGADVKYLVQELDQNQAQTLVDDIYQQILIICGMPNRNGGSSTSDTGKATIFRDGHNSALERAKSTGDLFKVAEKEFLRDALKIINLYDELDLKLSDVDICFSAQNYEDIQSKAQVLTTLLNNDMVHPETAYAVCDLFSDPVKECAKGLEWQKSKIAETERELEAYASGQTVRAQTEASADDNV